MDHTDGSAVSTLPAGSAGLSCWRRPAVADRHERAKRSARIRQLADARERTLAGAGLPPHVLRSLRSALHLSGELGVFSAGEADRCGLTPDVVQKLVRRRVLRRVERGWYALRTIAPTPQEAHLMRVSALVRASDGRAVASHHSALVVHGIATFGADLTTVHLTYRDGRHYRRRGGRVSHVGDASTRHLPPDAVAVDAAYAVVQAGMIAGELAALVAGDSALRRRLTTSEELTGAAGRYRRAAGVASVLRVLPYLDGRADSPLESLLRYGLRLLGYEPEVQYLAEVENEMRYKADLALPELRLILEADGAVKYASAEDHETPGSAVMEEKRRQSALERSGWTVLRFTHDDLVDAHGRLRLDEIQRRLDVALRGSNGAVGRRTGRTEATVRRFA